ncbi:MAG: T9SS type A sorting domain-containing protein [Flavobacteriales bacterium]|nr:T9SS type A sorting domain-containing protein [Flavobacteriales bacterium]
MNYCKLLLYFLFSIFVWLPTESFSQTKEIWGALGSGGEYGQGVVFKTDSNGDNYIVVHHFRNQNIVPISQQIVLDSNGVYYGVSSKGGAYGFGSLFSYNPLTKDFFTLHDFESNNAPNAHGPVANLVLGKNRKLYGVSNGGLLSLGTIFEYDLQKNKFQINAAFGNSSILGLTHSGGLTVDTGKSIYGLSRDVRNKHFLYRYDPTSHKINLLDTSLLDSNWYPANLFPHSNGKLYGLLRQFNTSKPAVYEYDPIKDSMKQKTSIPTVIGSGFGRLEEAANGSLFGITTSGGANGLGVIYKYDPNVDSFNVIMHLHSINTGYTFEHGFYRGKNNKLYALSERGGTFLGGTCLELDPILNTVSVKINFAYNSSFAWVVSRPIEDDFGHYLVFTSAGIMAIDTGTFTHDYILDFNKYPNGGAPIEGVVQAQNGKLYGVAAGGINKAGLIYEIDPKTNVFSVKKELMDSINDFDITPIGSPCSATNGKLYGLIRMDKDKLIYGRKISGVLYEYDPFLDTVIHKAYFEDSTYSFRLNPGIMQAMNGKIYGTTPEGGKNKFGFIFSYDILTDTLVKLFDLDTPLHGFILVNGFMQTKSGRLIGVGGDTHNDGIIVEYDYKTNKLIVLYRFNPTSTLGYWPVGKPVEVGNGVLYGLTRERFNLNNQGAVYKFDLSTNTYTYLKSFAPPGVTEPRGSFLLGSSGHLYSIINHPWTQSQSGFLLEYNMGINSMSNKKSLIHTPLNLTGFPPSHLGTFLTEIDGCFPGIRRTNNYACDSAFYKGVKYTNSRIIVDTLKKASSKGCDSLTYHTLLIYKTKAVNQRSESACDSYTWNANNITYTSSGVYNEKLKNSLGCDSLVELNLHIEKNSAYSYSVTACDLYNSPSGLFYWTSSGIYHDTIANNVGCDSAVTVHLTIKPSTFLHDTVMACSTYTWPKTGRTYTATDVYFDTIVNPNGCDTYNLLHLGIGNSSTRNLSPQYCDFFTSPSRKYTWTRSGRFTDTIKNNFGCDSIINYQLTIIRNDTNVSLNSGILTASTSGAAYQWLDCQNNYSPILGETGQAFWPKKSGSYAVEILGSNCYDTSGCHTIIIAGNEEKSLNNKYHLFPNPNSGIFTFVCPENLSKIELTLLNIQGQEISKPIFPSKNNSLEIEINGPSGVYILQVKDLEGNMERLRVIKSD